MLDIIRFFADWKSDIQSDLPANHTLSVPTVLNWKAKNSILFAVIGLVIVLLAAAITNFVVGAI